MTVDCYYSTLFTIISDYANMLGNYGQNPVVVLSQTQMTNWAVCQEV